MLRLSSSLKTYGSTFSARMRQEIGSVTAEFAAILPVVVLLLGLLAVVGGGQIARVGLVTAAADAARSLAVGESVSSSAEIQISAEHPDAEHVCAFATKTISALNFGCIELRERACARILGQ